MHGPEDRIDEERARAVWRRAAELQAEAAQRMEERARLSAGAGDAGDPSEPGFRRSDVEAAAVEAGISPEFVQLALAETEAGTSALAGWTDRAANRLLTSRRNLELTRTVAAPPAEIFRAMQRIFPAHPYLLTLRDTLGDPLRGGVLVFDLPRFNWSGNNTPFASDAYTLGVTTLRVLLRPAADGAECEVALSADLRRGVRANWWVGTSLAGFFGGGGALAGAGLGAAALGAAGALLALPALAGAAVVGGASGAGYGALYRWYLRKLELQLRDLLRTVDANARTRGAFAAPQSPPPGADDNGTAALLATW